jgi:cytochrome c
MDYSVRITLLLALLLPWAAHAGDPVAGESIFKTQCGICHTIEVGKNKVGPSLFGVVGRISGSVDGFHYSSANKAADITWTPEILDKYLTAPREVVPGTTMPFAGLKDEAKRADLIAYLATLR